MTLEDREVRVVREAVVNLNRERCASRMWCCAGPGPDDPAIARPGLEQHRVAAGSDGFDVQVRLEPIHDLTIRGQPGGSHQAVLFAIGDEDHQRVTSIASRAKHPRGFQRHRHPKSIVGRARRVGDGVGVRHQADRGALGSRTDADDVRDVRGASDLRPARVGFLHANVETVQPQLVDDVLAGPCVFGSAGRAAADGAREHLDVRAGVVQRETRCRAAARRGDRGPKQD